ncbi:MAG: ParB/RepB/Spo0J family partition protein [Firmicutes bacterium]|nr:ParB/RepB/Spo0J family partition protein [Bacillota bacterium]
MPFKLDDFFTTQETRNEENREHIESIDLDLIDDFISHPFKVIDNEELKQLEESIKQNGILSPAIVRKKEDGRYEMVSGHRRKFACEKLGLKSIPCIVKDLTLDEATIFMVDSNLQREKLLPSEKAFAYKMKYDALKNQRDVNQHDTSVRQVGTVIRSDDLLAAKSDDSARQIHRYIRLTNLVPELLEMVDNTELKQSPSIAFNPAVELSYLTEDEQRDLVDIIDENLATPSLSQAIQMKKLSQENNLSIDDIQDILDQEKPNQVNKFKINEDKLYKVIPRSVDRDKVEDYVIKACEFYTRHLKQRENER